MSIGCCAKPPPGETVVIELDEMWHFLQRKDNKVWIWKAFDRATGRLVDWECGDRDDGPSGGCSSASPAGRCACSAPTTMSFTRWCWQSAATTRQRRDGRPGTQHRPATALDCGPAAALHCRFQVPRHDRAPGSPYSPTCTSTRMPLLRCTGCQSKLVKSSHCLKCNISPLNPPVFYQTDCRPDRHGICKDGRDGMTLRLLGAETVQSPEKGRRAAVTNHGASTWPKENISKRSIL